MRLFLLPLAACAALLLTPAAAPAFTARVPDPAGGPDWAARAWIRPEQPGEGEAARCLQVGRVVEGQLARVFADGETVPLAPRQRIVCAGVDSPSSEYLPLLIERYADRRVAPTRLVRTVVAGVPPRGARTVTLVVRGRPRALRLHGAPRTFLAVLPGDVRRRDLVVRFRTAKGVRGVDLTSSRRSVQDPRRPQTLRAVRHPLTLPDPTGAGPPVALTAYRLGGELCVEPGRRVAGEAGSWSPAWGTFLESPTLVALRQFEEPAADWQPLGSPPPQTNGCTNRYDDERRAPRALTIRRLAPDLLAVAGVLHADERAVAVRDPTGAPAPVTIRGRLFLATVRSTGALHEALVLTRTADRGRAHVVRIPTGEQELVPDELGVSVREGGRVVRVAWIGGFEPFVGVDARVEGGRLRVMPLERFPPYFTDDGGSTGTLDIGIPKCADVELPDALVGLPVHDAKPEQPSRPGGDVVERTCVRIAPGQRLDPAAHPEDPGASATPR